MLNFMPLVGDVYLIDAYIQTLKLDSLLSDLCVYISLSDIIYDMLEGLYPYFITNTFGE